MRATGPVQPGWGNPNRGWHTVCPDDSMERHKGPRAPSVGKPADQGKGMGASPTRDSVARMKVTIAVVVSGQGSGDGGTILHGDRDGGGVGAATA
jgi:hypothetical protein